MQQQYCDICQEEPAAQMLSNMESGTVMTLGLNCLPVFYEQSIRTLLEAGEHKGPASKCQACRRVHEKITTPVAQIGDVSRETPPPDELLGAPGVIEGEA
jgi:hypothetical protein